MSASDPLVSRFDAQPTRWSMIQKAHGQSMLGGNEARQYLVMRYSSAIRSYVRAMTRNEDQADDITQDVIVRLLQGDFAGADPTKGRFRDLLKTAVRNMTRNVWSKQNRRKTADFDLSEVSAESDIEVEEEWTESWQSQLITLTMQRLKEYQQSHQGSIAHTVMTLRMQHPEASSEQMAEFLTAEIGKPVNADQARQQLRRARVRFAEYLVEEVADGLADPTKERIEEELAAVGLLSQVRDVLPVDWKSAQ